MVSAVPGHSAPMERRAFAGSPVVSVVMPFFDAEAFIDEAIRSVLDQTFDGWELVLVDDGSTDRSREIATRYTIGRSERIRIVEHPENANLGLRRSRHLGIRSARGTYVAFLDADDVYEPFRLERHVALLDEDSDLIAVQGLVTYWRSWSDRVHTGHDTVPLTPLTGLDRVVRPPGLLDLLLHSSGGTAPAACAVTIRRSALSTLTSPEIGPQGLYEDQVLFAQIYLTGRIRLLNTADARYRQHEKSMTGRARASQLDQARRSFLAWLRDYLCESGMDRDSVLFHLIEREERNLESGAREQDPPFLRGLARRYLPDWLLRLHGDRRHARRQRPGRRLVAEYLESEHD